MKPILSITETKHLDFLNDCLMSNNTPVQTVGNQTNYNTAKELMAVGALVSHVLETKTKGNKRIGFTITEKGKMLLEQMEQFSSGYMELNSHNWQQLIYYWQVWNVPRVLTYAMNVLVMGGEQNHERNSEIILMENNDSFHARGMVEIYQLTGSPNHSDFIPVSEDEKAGGRFGTRVGKMDRWMINFLYDYLGTRSPRELMEYLLTVGMTIAMKQMNEMEQS